MSLPEPPFYPPRPRGRPPLADRHRNRLTLKLPGNAAARASSANANSNPALAAGSLADGPPLIPGAAAEDADAPQLEEHFILRVLPEMAPHFGRLVGERRIQDHLEITFRDDRNAIVRFDGASYCARLVDLPTITESYRTLDKKQMLKTADICQMLLIERRLESPDESIVLARGLDVIYPDGLAPALANVRKTRFRRRIPNAKIDAIEREVLRLLEDDANAVAVKFETVDAELNSDDPRAATPSIDIMSPVTIDDFNTPRVADEDNDDDDANSSVAIDDLEFDENLAAELEQGLEELEGEDEEEEDDEDDEDDNDIDARDDEDLGLDLDMGDQPSNERAMQMRLLGEETAELERTISKKRADLDSAPNPIIRRRFEDMIQRLEQELDSKHQQLQHYAQEIAREQQDSND
ncbi:hypothetical protein GGI04_000707 [Coemansia thaxteri]|uniref:TAFII55 protein conserved region domain-containing protein n=1 Tax=Coemansia thaxteri TaxID=2663907 RepID=A0A9W8BNA5_9FUNG|nr:hypothetical protein H4R26_000671 [Coemansia thaxteri]KAJ2009106.1 hypothetical protein GGI04_000707 [Coemansia thaxteri]KAJ2474039.1 hypothetical protein GGI02_000385 [Coemansia sp. RSA 2322]KAJ2486935.1 hypothetical protein EV174_000835 [Coemansia sp. RSA 2320]